VKEDTMQDIATTIDAYFAIWNETDASRRRLLIERTWSDDSTYADPLLTGEGHAGIDAMMAATQAQFPGHTVRLAGPIDNHHDRLRFNWEIVGPDGGEPVFAGVDYGVLASDGRLRSIAGFLDRVPAALANG
jgi:hypothetical protein